MVDIVIKQRPMVDNAIPSEKKNITFSYLSHINKVLLPTLIMITFMAQKETLTVCNNNTTNNNSDDVFLLHNNHHHNHNNNKKKSIKSEIIDFFFFYMI